MKDKKAPVLDLNGQRFRLTWHAAQRAIDMDLHPDEIREALENPRKVIDSVHYAGSSYWTAGRVTVAVTHDEIDPDAYCVTTVLWSTQKLWKQYFRRSPVSDRTERDGTDWRRHKEAIPA